MCSSILAAATATLASIPFSAEAQIESPGEWRIYSENDFFNPFTEQTDRYYTQGLRLERLSRPRGLDESFLPGISHGSWCSLLCGELPEGTKANAGFAGGQNMYTPAEIRIAAPQPNDRPWAGYLYGSRIAQISYRESTLKAERQDRIEVSLGIVGPASLAKQTQIRWHHLIGADRPEGWDNQLRNEPVLQVRYETALRWATKGGHADVIPRVRGNLGNALTSLEAEVVGRVGWKLSGFGVQVIPATPPPPPPPPSPLPPSAVFAMAGPESASTSGKVLSSANPFLRGGIKAVAHNIFLDGNTFADNDIRIRRKPFVPEIAIGVEANLVGNFWMSAQFVRRGSEFETRSGRDAPAQDFGALTFTLKNDD